MYKNPYSQTDISQNITGSHLQPHEGMVKETGLVSTVNVNRSVLLMYQVIFSLLQMHAVLQGFGDLLLLCSIITVCLSLNMIGYIGISQANHVRTIYW